MKIYEGKLEAAGKKVAIVISKFNSIVSDRLLEGAMNAYYQMGGDDKDVDVYKVTGSYEIAGVAKKLMAQKKYNAIVCLGAIIRGGTPHFEYVSSNSAKAIMELSMSGEVPVIYGLITADDIEQALDRAGLKSGNKGYDAMKSAMEMVSLYNQI